MSAVRRRPNPLELPVDRIIGLSDGMFAIIMTLLVLTIEVPDIPAGEVSEQLRSELGDLGPTFYSYVLSFAILGFNWIGHHAVYHFIRRSNSTLIWLNLTYLLLLALVPFSTDLFGEYDNQRIAAVIYVGNVFIVSLLLFIQWWYAADGHRLIESDTDPYLIREEYLRRIIGPVGFGLAFFVVILNVTAGVLVMIAAGFAHLLVRPITDRMMGVSTGDAG